MDSFLAVLYRELKITDVTSIQLIVDAARAPARTASQKPQISDRRKKISRWSSFDTYQAERSRMGDLPPMRRRASLESGTTTLEESYEPTTPSCPPMRRRASLESGTTTLEESYEPMTPSRWQGSSSIHGNDKASSPGRTGTQTPSAAAAAAPPALPTRTVSPRNRNRRAMHGKVVSISSDTIRAASPAVLQAPPEVISGSRKHYRPVTVTVVD